MEGGKKNEGRKEEKWEMEKMNGKMKKNDEGVSFD